MKTTISTIFSIILIVGLQISISAQKLNTEKLDKYIEKAKTQWNIPGLAIAVVKDGSVYIFKRIRNQRIREKGQSNR
jgi:CubicO group peptidase (beta-lactamase class C family)